MESTPGRFTAEAREDLARAIRDAAGNEVFALGTLTDDKVDGVRVLARGPPQRRPGPDADPTNRRGGDPQPPFWAAAAIRSRPRDRVHPGQRGVGFYIVDNAVDRVYAVVEPMPPERVALVAPEQATAILGPDGVLAQSLGGYEHRPQQLEMLEAVTHAFNDEEVMMVEAGTGTGKSLAYLIPAILWAKANRSRVIVSSTPSTCRNN